MVAKVETRIPFTNIWIPTGRIKTYSMMVAPLFRSRATDLELHIHSDDIRTDICRVGVGHSETDSYHLNESNPSVTIYKGSRKITHI